MIKIVDTLYSKLPAQFANVPASTVISLGQGLAQDFTNKGLIPVTSSVGTTITFAGVATQAIASSGSVQIVKYVPLDGAVFCVVDTTSNTAAAQLNINHAMTDGLTVANTSSNIATTLGIFHALGTVGAATNKKLYGYFNRVGQVTA